MHERDEKRAELPTFLGLTFALSAVLWGVIISAGSLRANNGLYVLALMWAPGVSAIVTRLIFHKSVRGLGWVPRGPRWLALAYVLPLLYGGAAYGLSCLSDQCGVARRDPESRRRHALSAGASR